MRKFQGVRASVGTAGLWSVLAVLLTCTCLPDHAAGDNTSKPKAAVAQKAPASRDVLVTVSNQRKSPVIFFTVIGKESNGQEPNLLKDVLATGKSIKVKAKGLSGCVASVTADFEDGSSVEASGLDLCKDPVVKLID